jgi:N utilization substance protein B
VGGRAGHRRRRSARRTAVDILYQADLLERPAHEVIAQWRSLGRSVPEYSQELVERVEEREAEIDRALGEHAEGWTVPRMAVVDRTILRVACQELSAGVPVAVVINEAVEMANELSTEDSGRFVNGVLGRIAEDLGESAPE